MAKNKSIGITRNDFLSALIITTTWARRYFLYTPPLIWAGPLHEAIIIL